MKIDKPKVDLHLAWSYRYMFTGDSNQKKDVLQNMSNIAFFVPFGLLLSEKNWKIVMITACLFSVLIEIIL